MNDRNENKNERGDDVLSNKDSETDSEDIEVSYSGRRNQLLGGKRKRNKRLQPLVQNDEMECNNSSNNNGSTQHYDYSDWDDESGKGKRPKKHGRRILLNQSLDDGMVFVHSIDSAVVDDDLSRKRREKLHRAKQLRDITPMGNIGRWFNWYSLYYRNFGGDTIISENGEIRKKELHDGSCSSYTNSCRDILNVVERKMGPNMG